MKSLVLVGYFEEVFYSIRKYTNFNKILIIEKKNVIDIKYFYNFFDEVIEVDDFLDKQEMSSVVENIMKKNQIKAIYAAHEWVVEICGYLRDKFKINGIGEMVAKSTRDKYLMKTILSNEGIKTAKVRKIVNKKDIEEFVNENGYPILIKPQNGAATQNTYLIKSNKDLENILTRVDIENNSFIIESFNKGQEYHVDSIVINGKVIYCSVGKYISNCIDTVLNAKPVASIIYPSQYDDDEIISGIKNINTKVINILKIQDSICHMEVFVTEDKEIIFGEIATRIGGGPLIGKTIRYGYDMDIYDEFIKIGINQSVDKRWKAEKFVGFIALPTKHGRIMEISSPEDYKDVEGIKEVCILNKVGDDLEDAHNTVMRIGYIIAEAESYDVLRKRLLDAYKKFKLVVKEPRISLASIY